MASLGESGDSLDLVYEAVRSVMQSDEEVGRKREGQDSLEAVAALFPRPCSITLTTVTGPAANFQVLRRFSENLVSEMKSILVVSNHTKLSTFQEQSLRKFHCLRIDMLPLIWQTLAEGLELPPVNAFQQQAVNRYLFERLLVKSGKSLAASVTASKPRTQLTVEEDNAVQYAGGYVAMKLLNKYKDHSSGIAVEYVDCLSNMACSGQESSFHDYAMEWIARVDRGKLFYINHPTFSFFKAIEIKTQELIPLHLTAKAHKPSKNDMIKAIMQDSDVDFWWSMLAIDISTSAHAAAELLAEIVDMWVTTRGFALVSFWLEQYKGAQKASVKKSKSLRKKLQDQI